MPRQIHFKKQMLGKWRRDDGEAKTLVNEESMFREVATLLNDGWKFELHGVTLLRGITMYENNVHLLRKEQSGS
jgi:hypothetical protein